MRNYAGELTVFQRHLQLSWLEVPQMLSKVVLRHCPNSTKVRNQGEEPTFVR